MVPSFRPHRESRSEVVQRTHRAGEGLSDRWRGEVESRWEAGDDNTIAVAVDARVQRFDGVCERPIEGG
jgi:hypothetical protein